MIVDAICAWCLGPIPPTLRRDAVCCSVKCRQARHRFDVSPASPKRGRAHRFAYADPAYPKLHRYYDLDAPTDHAALVGELVRDYPDGWALSTSSTGLREVLPLVPEREIRIGAYVRRDRKVRSKFPRDEWEALIVWRGRPQRLDASHPTTNVCMPAGRQRTHPGALIGMKPHEFAVWMFAMLGARQGDDLVDRFPGSGAIGRAWAMFQGREAEWIRASSPAVDSTDARAPA